MKINLANLIFIILLLITNTVYSSDNEIITLDEMYQQAEMVALVHVNSYIGVSNGQSSCGLDWDGKIINLYKGGSSSSKINIGFYATSNSNRVNWAAPNQHFIFIREKKKELKKEDMERSEYRDIDKACMSVIKDHQIWHDGKGAIETGLLQITRNGEKEFIKVTRIPKSILLPGAMSIINKTDIVGSIVEQNWNFVEESVFKDYLASISGNKQSIKR